MCRLCVWKWKIIFMLILCMAMYLSRSQTVVMSTCNTTAGLTSCSAMKPCNSVSFPWDYRHHYTHIFTACTWTSKVKLPMEPSTLLETKSLYIPITKPTNQMAHMDNMILLCSTTGEQQVLQVVAKITKDHKGNNALPYIGLAWTLIETSPQLQCFCIARQTAVDSTHPSYQSYIQNNMSTCYSNKFMNSGIPKPKNTTLLCSEWLAHSMDFSVRGTGNPRWQLMWLH